MEPEQLVKTLIGLGFGLFIVVGGLVFMRLSAKKERARQAASAAYAAHREWDYTQKDPALVSLFKGPPFGRGHTHYAGNAFSGRHGGRPFVAFDYNFATGARDSRRIHLYSIVALTLDVETPGMEVAPTGLFDRVVDAVTGRDVAIGNAEFDKQFTVTSASTEFAIDVLHPDVVQVLMSHRDLAWRLEGTSMVVVRKGAHNSPEDVETRLQFMDDVLDRIPDQVRARLLGDPPAAPESPGIR